MHALGMFSQWGSSGFTAVVWRIGRVAWCVWLLPGDVCLVSGVLVGGHT